LVVLLAVATGCYGTPRTSFPDDSGGSGGSGASAGTGGGHAGTGGVGPAGGQAGTAGSGGMGTGAAGTSGSGGSNAVFIGGPCVTSVDLRSVEIFAKSSDGRIYRRLYDGTNWGSWTPLIGVDGSMVDARSDLDCSASATSVHIVATGLNPVGAFLHAFGSGVTYNPFMRELPTSSFAPSPSIVELSDTRYIVGALAIGATYPVVYEIGGDTGAPQEFTPISTQSGSFRSAPDIAFQSQGASGVTYFAAFDSSGELSIYYYVVNSGGAHWADPVGLSPPIGTFSFSPAICTETGGPGNSVNVVAVAGGQLWYSKTSLITESFSPWTAIAADPQSSPDCAVADETEGVVHVVMLSGTGTVLDVNGKGTTWVVTDLGPPPR
jgi:hypothetical protein